MATIFLYNGAATLNNIILSDPSMVMVGGVPEQPLSIPGTPQPHGFRVPPGFLGRPHNSNRYPTPPRQSGPPGFLRKH